MRDSGNYYMVFVISLLGAFMGHMLGGAVAIAYKGYTDMVAINNYSFKWGIVVALVTMLVSSVAFALD